MFSRTAERENRINGASDSTILERNGKKKQYIQPYKKDKGVSIMIWAAILG